MAERTLAPTPKRIRQARDRGDVPRAPLAAAALGVFAAIALVPGIVRALGARLGESLSTITETSRVDPWSIALPVVSLVAPLAGLLAAIAVVVGVAQGAVTLSARPLSPDLARLDLFSGLRRLAEPARVWGAARGILVVILGAAVVARTLLAAAVAGAVSVGSPSHAVVRAADFAQRGAVACGLVGALFAIVDLIVGRRLYLGRLRMTREEVVREHKEGEGDPEVKRRREELRHELLAAQALAAVRDATVVVVNPTHLACALRYERSLDDDDAPTLVARGEGALAARMIEAARAYGVPIVRDVPVAHALADLEVGTEIPETLYEAVAEVLRAAWEGDGEGEG